MAADRNRTWCDVLFTLLPCIPAGGGTSRLPVCGFALIALISCNLQAQEARLEGHVYDEQGTPLIGAIIRVLGSVIGTSTDAEGAYEIEVPPGEIRIISSYLGYRDADTTITVANADRAIDLDIVLLEEGPNELPELIVFGTRAIGQAQALRLQQSALAPQTIVHRELFNRYPDITIAETVSRLPGVSIIRDVNEGQIVQVRGLPEQFTAVSLNGQRLPTIQPEADQEGTLDLIQSNLVDEVRAIKARTADMDGDAIGGTVDFRIRQPQRKFEVLAQGGIGTNFGFDGNLAQQKGITQLTGVLNSEIADEKVYALLAGSYFRHGRGVQERVLDYGRGEIFGDPQDVLIESRPTNVNRLLERRGIIGAVELRPSVYNRLRLSFNYSENNQDVEERQLFLRDNHEFGGGRISQRGTTYNKRRQLELVSLEVENNFPKTRIDYQISFSQTRENLNDRLSNIYSDSLADRFPVFGPDVLTAALPGGFFNSQQLSLTSSTQENIGLEEDVAILSLNVTRYLNKAKTSYLRAGGRYRSKDRTYGTLFISDPNPVGRNVTGGNFDDLPREPIADDLPDLPDGALRYSARQRIEAGYAMYAANLSQRVSLSAGVRYEGLEVVTRELDQDTFSLRERDWLPSLNLTYRIRRDRQIRLSAYQAVARANYATYLSDRPVPLISLDETSIGNQSIRNTHSNNIDLSFERYGRRDGLLSFALYYKTLDNPTLRVSTTERESVLDVPVYRTQLVNIPSADLFGIEVGFYQNLGFIGDANGWRFWNVNGNYNFNALGADSRRFTFDSFTLPQAPRQTANLSLVHNNPNKGISVVAALNVRDQIFDRVLDDRPVYRNGLVTLDLAADYRFYKAFSVYLRANNLTNHSYEEFFGKPGEEGTSIRSSAQFGTWGVIGVRYQPDGTDL